jgi:hypothetical protein
LLQFPEQMVPACSAKVSNTNVPSCIKWFRQVTKYDYKVWCHPRSTEHDTQPIAYLISKHVIPYRIHGGTCCSRASTPKIQSLEDSSMTNYITWRNPTVSTIPSLLKPHHQSSPWSNHISMDGRTSLKKTQAKLNITKDGKTCMTLMTTWLSITNQVWIQILKYEAYVTLLKYACQCVYTRERNDIGSIWSRVTCLGLLLAAAQSLERWAPSDSRSLRRLMVAIGNK